jgi:molybdate/tungstate transport system permease protein
MMKETLHDRNVVRSIWLSVYTALAAAGISFVVGTPLAYVLARLVQGQASHREHHRPAHRDPAPRGGHRHPGRGGKEPLAGPVHERGRHQGHGTTTGIIAVLTFVGMPFYINALKSGIEAVSPRLENVSRSLGASMWGTFARVTFPLAWRSVLVGLIMCCARAISEFGAVVVVAYHPMIAPVLIYERYEAYGLKYSQPVAVWLVLVCLTLFLVLRVLALPGKKAA